MCVLANVLEAAGLATVGISLVRAQAENGRAPRMLHCEFPLGRPLGRPGDPEFQHDVLGRAFSLLDRTDVPVLDDHPEVIDDQTEEPAACPIPPRHDPDVPEAIDEVRGLRNAYRRQLDQSGRTLVGRIGSADDVETLVATFLRLADGESLTVVGWDQPTFLGATQDVRAYYEEAALQLADVTDARRIESWFYGQSATGKLLKQVQVQLKSAGEDRDTWYYVVPTTQAR